MSSAAFVRDWIVAGSVRARAGARAPMPMPVPMPVSKCPSPQPQGEAHLTHTGRLACSQTVGGPESVPISWVTVRAADRSLVAEESEKRGNTAQSTSVYRANVRYQQGIVSMEAGVGVGVTKAKQARNRARAWRGGAKRSKGLDVG